MSRHPSPGPSHSATQHPSSAPSRRSRPSHSIGIAAGAEDVKYQGKYKDLKRKVKEIEGENDRLHFKILEAKRSLQRMKLERAILYERMSSASPAGDVVQTSAAPPPPSRSYSGRDRPSGETEGDLHRRPAPPDPAPARMDPPQVLPSPHMSAVHSPRHNSATHDTSRHLPPLQHLPPVAQYDSAARPHSHSHPPPAHSPPIHHAQPRSQSSRPPPPAQNFPVVPGQQYPEPLPPVQRVLHSPPPHSDRDRSSRRTEPSDYPSDPSHLQPHSRHPSQVSPNLHPAETRTPSNRVHPHQRGLAHSSYVNREDALSRQYELEREKGRDARGDRDRDTRGREPSTLHSPHATHRRVEYPDHPHLHHTHSLPPLAPPPSHYSSHARSAEDVYYHDSGNPYPSVHVPRSDTPGSGSNNSGIDQGGPPGERGGIPSRPDSRTQYYEDRISAHSVAGRPSYRLRPVSQSNNTTTHRQQSEDAEFRGHDRDDALGRSQSHDARLSSSSTPAITSTVPPTSSGPNNASSGNAPGGVGGAGPQTGYPQHPPPPLGSGLSSHFHPSDRERYERGQSPISSSTRKRSRNDMEMDIDNDSLDNHNSINNSNNNSDVGGRGTADSGSGSRRNTPAPGFSDERDRDRGSMKRYQREHPQSHYRDDQEGSAPPPSASHAPPSAGPTSSTQDHHEDSRMGSS